MSSSFSTKLSTARWLVLTAGFLSFFIPLDRYPQFHIDESFFNYPAISYLKGNGFRYAVSSHAPHRDELWAYHAPFYPRLQIATFRFLGIRQFTVRAPEYVAAYLAIVLLCHVLATRGLPASALLLAIVWVGDRSSQEVLYGRMEGIALLCVATGFLALLRLLERPSTSRGIVCGACLGTAVGFHPVTTTFVLATTAVILGVLGPGDRRRAMLGFVMGGMLPLGLFLWAWLPDIPACWEQFRWSLGVATSKGLGTRVSNLLTNLGWARYWIIALFAAVVTGLVPEAFARLSEWRRATSADRRISLWLAACCFSIAGLGCLATRAVFSYYLAYFTVWPVIALAVPIEAHLRLKFPRWFHFICILVTIAWLPSLGWNAMRFREVVICWKQLDHSTFTNRLASVIPKGAPVVCLPELFLIAEEAGLVYEPLPWIPEGTEVSPESWLLVSDAEWRTPRWISPRSLATRRIVLAGSGFPGAGVLEYKFVLLGPAAPGEP